MAFLNEKVDLENVVAIHDMENTALNEVAVEMNDGSITLYLFSEPVKFEDENGEIRFKETNIVEQNDVSADSEGFEFTNGENDVCVDFSPDIETGVQLTTGETTLTLMPIPNEEAEPSDGEVTEIPASTNSVGL